jgi:hypothetical protein
MLVVRILGHTLCALAILLLLAYFALVSGPGERMISRAIETEIEGTAGVEGVRSNPFDGSVAVLGVTILDARQQPVLSLGRLALVPDTLPGLWSSRFAVVTASDARLQITVDENGRSNLDGLFKEKPEEEEKPPTPYQVKRLNLERLSIDIDTPQLTATVSASQVEGDFSGDGAGQNTGEVRLLLKSILLTAKDPGLSMVLDRLFASGASVGLGPVAADVRWTPVLMALSIRELAYPGGTATVRAEFPVGPDGTVLADAPSEIRLTLHQGGQRVIHLWFSSREGKQNLELDIGALNLPEIALPGLIALPEFRLAEGKIHAHLSLQEWGASARIRGLEIKGNPGTVPEVNLPLFHLDATSERLFMTLEGLKLERHTTPDLSFSGARMDMRIQLEPTVPLSRDWVAQVIEGTGQPAGFQELVRRLWGKGDATLKLEVRDVQSKASAFPNPVLVEMEGHMTPDKRYSGRLLVKPGVPGVVAVSLEGDRANARLNVRLGELDLLTLLTAVKAPDKAISMLGGTADGPVVVDIPPGQPTKPVLRECDLRISLPKATTRITIPAPDQELDVNKAPSAMAFLMLLAKGSGDLKFGDGVVQIRREDSTK